MRLNETDEERRRIGPLRAIDDDGDPVVDFSTPGSVQISVNNGAFADADGEVVDIGSGYVYYQATAGDASELGFVTVKLSVVCRESTFREDVELAPNGIPVDTTDPDLLHVGPLYAVDEFGDPLPDLTGVTTEISINGSAWSAPAGAATMISGGYVDFVPDSTEVDELGWIAVRISGACQDYVFRADIVTESEEVGEPVEPTPPATPVPVTHEDIPVINHVALALDRLPQQYRGTDDVPTELITP